jgi:hypothetical protein
VDGVETENAAETVVLAFMVTLQEDVPLHAPPHPANVEFDPGASLSVTTVPAANVATQLEPQLMPAGLLVMVPAPAPELCTVSWYVDGEETENAAETVVLAFMVTLQVLMPLHPPPHPANAEVDPAAALSVTTVPAANVATQLEPQLMPAGLLVMVPTPAPELCTMS